MVYVIVYVYIGDGIGGQWRHGEGKYKHLPALLSSVGMLIMCHFQRSRKCIVFLTEMRTWNRICDIT